MEPAEVSSAGPGLSVIPTRSTPPEPVHIVILCQAAGLTAAAYSFGYVAGWSAGDPKKVKATAERVVTCARQILDRAGLLDPTADDAQEAQAA